MIDTLSDRTIRLTFLAIWPVGLLAYLIGRVAWDVAIALMIIHIVIGR
jgi:hypothetical protein